MNPPDGFDLFKCVRSDDDGEVFLARESATGRQVLIKSYRGGDAHTARQEYERLRRLAGPGLVVPLDLDTDGPEPLLVLRGFECETLADRARRPAAIGTWLDVAARLAAALRHLHAKHWIHRDLDPRKVLIAHDSHEILLLDLDLASEFGSGVRHEASGNPVYMAPEQFGRMGRGIDFRSDLYSLGATLYQLLTGQPPFPGDDRLELMHAHMAQRPTPPGELRPEVPGPLSRMLLKLLEKEPDERYQSVHALHHDVLECQRLWAEHEALPDDFALGSSDANSRPLFSKRLYGRDPEIEALAQALERVRQGACEVWTVRGSPGVGKSVLIQELRARSLERGSLVQGKFDLYRRDQPYSGWSAALEALAQQILARGDREIRGWKERIASSLQANAAVLAEWIPDWAFILGSLPAAPRLEPRETQVRLARTTLRLLQAAARPEEPLILFLDDLQWADAGSRFLLREILREQELPGLLMVGTYRDAEIDSAHPLTAVLEEVASGPHPLHTLDIGPLPRDATLCMLADAFDQQPDEVRDLADLILTKTENNPFLIQQFVDHMRSLGHIRFEQAHDSGSAATWRWDLEAIAAADISDDAVELIAARIERIEPHAKEVLVFASFIGDEFDAEMLCALANRDLAAVEFALCALSENGLVVPCRAGFRFVHDRIREAAQSLRSDTQRIQLHYDTATLLLERTPREELRQASAELVEHFNRALSMIPEEKLGRVIQLNVWAAERALHAGAPGTARGLVDAAHGLAERAQGEIDASLLFELDLLRSATRIATEEYAEADKIVSRWSERDLAPLDLARVAALRIDIYTFMTRQSARPTDREAHAATAIAIAALRRLDAPYPADPGAARAMLEVLRTYWSIRGLTADDFLRMSKPADDRQRAISLLEAAIGPLYYVRPSRCLFASARLLRRFREGYGEGLVPVSLWGVAVPLLLAFGWRDVAERMAEISLELMERGCPTLRAGGAGMGVHYLLLAWIRHPSQTATRVEALTRAALEGGDLLMTSAGAQIVTSMRLQAGEPLDAIVTQLRAAEELARRAHDSGYLRSLRDTRRILECLQAPRLLTGDEAPYTAEVDPNTELLRGEFWLLLEDYPRALESFTRTPDSFGIPTHVPFHRALTCLALLEAPDFPDKHLCRRCLRLDRLRLWRLARLGPSNFLHQRLLVEAERARLAGRTRAAFALGQQAVQRARDARFPVDTALALERLARVLTDMNRPVEAAEKLGQALTLYERWGAHAKVAHMRKHHARDLPLAQSRRLDDVPQR